MTRIIRMLVAVSAAAGLALLGFVTAGAASAGTYTSGAWKLTAPSTDSYLAQVQQPINSDGSSVFNHKSSTIPVQFKVTDTRSFAFESLSGATTVDNGLYSAASYTPASPITVSDLTGLTADYKWATGTDHGGSLRWSITTSDGNSIFVYYGDEPNYTSETPGVNGSGANLLSLTDQRVDTSKYASGTFYDTWAHASSPGFLGNDVVTSVSLVVDGGWGGSQVLTLADANVTDSVNGTSTFTMPGSVTTPTNSAPAYISLYHASGIPGPVDESTLTSTQGDSGGQFRQVDGKYIYNLPVSQLQPNSDYTVGLSFNPDGSSPVPNTVHFGLR